MPEGTATDRGFDAVVGSLDPAMVIVTTAHGGARAGCLVGFHSQSSIGPRRYALWLSKANHTYRLAVECEYLAVHYLSADDRALAVLFGTTTDDDSEGGPDENDSDKFERCSWTEGPHGMPLLDACPRRVVLRRTGLFDDGGDHVCFTGEAVDVAGADRFRPLRLADVDDLDPGHDAGDRPG